MTAPPSRRSAQKRQETVFSASQVTQLRDLLRAGRIAAVLPKLEHAARVYKDVERKTVADEKKRHETARSLTAVGSKLERQLRALLPTLKAARVLIDDASSLGYVQPHVRSAGTLGGLAQGSVEATEQLDELRTIATDVAARAHAWQKLAGGDVRRKRGRKVGDRRHLAGFVALQLDRAGVPVKKNANGVFAQVLTIVYEAAGIASPHNLFADIKQAFDDLHRPVR